MDKKEKISQLLKKVEVLMYNVIDENEPIDAFDALAITIDLLLERRQLKQKPLRFKITDL